jgi:protein-S-isoprenylcysteine O-methyltransferase Ste14
VGLFLLFPAVSSLIAVFIIIAYTIIGMHLEERKLIDQFGDQYKQYQKKVPMIIPFWK